MKPRLRVQYIFIIISLCFLVTTVAWFYVRHKNFPLTLSNNAVPSPTPTPAILLEYRDYPTNIQKLSFDCPLSKSYCSDTNIKSATISAVLAKPTSVYAAFDGEVRIFKSEHPLESGKTEPFIEIILQNRTTGLSASYYFKGDTVMQSQVKAGQQLGTLNGQTISFMANKSFIFNIYKVTASGYQIVGLSQIKFVSQ